MAIKYVTQKEEAENAKLPSGDETVTLTLSSAVLAMYRASGTGWEERLNSDLIRRWKVRL